MARPLLSLRALRRDACGTMVVEAAFVLPILCALCFGAFEVSRMVARNAELQSAMGEAAGIVLAHPPQEQAEIDAIESIVEASTGLAADKVTVARRFRCGADPALVTTEAACGGGVTVSSYLQITAADTYTPQWVGFGVGAPVALSVTRTVQIG